MNSKIFIFFILIIFFIALPIVSAHCPLCVVGAAAMATGASSIGVSNAIVGLFTGAFAVSTGWWIANKLKKKYIPFQKSLLILSSFALTVIPITRIIQEYYGIYIGWGGDYGSLFNSTYIINKFLVGSIVGGSLLFVTPWLSKKITFLRNGIMIPYQGVLLTFLLLIILGGIFQLFLK